MKRIRLLILLFAAMFCSNVLYAQTYVTSPDSTIVIMTIGESDNIYAGDYRGTKYKYVGKFEGDEIKIPLLKKVLSYRNGELYLKDNNNLPPLLKIIDDKTYFTIDGGETYTYALKKVDNKVFSVDGKLVWLYSGLVPDKIHAMIALLIFSGGTRAYLQ